MSSTNKTTHYELSQYVGSDKPTYLSDYNGDMLKIDTGINAAKTVADTASAAITSLSADVVTAQTTANTAVTNAAAAQTTADGANTKIGTLANLTTTVKTDVVSSINEVVSSVSSEATRLTQMFNFNHKQVLTTPASTSNCTRLDGSFTVEANNDYSIFKICGDYRLTVTNSNPDTIKVTFNTDLRPTTDYTIQPFALVYNENGTVISYAIAVIYTTGVLEVSYYSMISQGQNPWIYASDTLHFMSENN